MIAEAMQKSKATTFAAADCERAMTIRPGIAVMARQILDELNAGLETGEDLRRGNRGIGLRLRFLLTMTDSFTGPIREARLAILRAIRRTAINRT